MLYTYNFANKDDDSNVPSSSIVEIDENSEWGRVMLGYDDNFRKGQRREQDHAAFSLNSDSYDGEGPALIDPRTPETILLHKEKEEYLNAGLRSLPPDQGRRLEDLADGMKKSEIAREEGRHHSTVGESIGKAQKNFKKYLEENPY